MNNGVMQMCLILCEYLGAFMYLRKRLLSLSCLFVRLIVWPYGITRLPVDRFFKKFILVHFKKSLEKI
jgi:hypothetical protein